MSWTRLRGVALGVTVLVSACAGSAPSTATSDPGGSAQDSDALAAGGDGADGAQQSSTAGPVDEAGPSPGSAGPGSRATLSATVLTDCSAAEVIEGAHTPVALTLDPPVGGCWLTEGFGAPGSPRAASLLRALPDEAALRAVLSCRPDQQLESDADASYFTLRDVHHTSDTWEVVFSEDDGARVHVGLRIRRACQGTPSQQVQATTLLALPGRERALTVHFCEPDPTPCPPVP